MGQQVSRGDLLSGQILQRGNDKINKGKKSNESSEIKNNGLTEESFSAIAPF